MIQVKRVSIGYLRSIDRDLADRLDELRRHSETLDAEDALSTGGIL